MNAVNYTSTDTDIALMLNFADGAISGGLGGSFSDVELGTAFFGAAASGGRFTSPDRLTGAFNLGDPNGTSGSCSSGPCGEVIFLNGSSNYVVKGLDAAQLDGTYTISGTDGSNVIEISGSYLTPQGAIPAN